MNENFMNNEEPFPKTEVFLKKKILIKMIHLTNI